MHPLVEEIIEAYNPAILLQVDAALNLHVTNFKRDLFPILRDIDQSIPGAGFQYVIWVDHDPKFPFPGDEFDSIARSMKYIPDTLASGMKFPNMARFIAQSSTAHVESCVKATCRSLALPVVRHDMKPLGALAKDRNVINALGTSLATSLSKYAQVLGNIAKHEYGSGSPQPMISFPDALGGYFASRILGFSVLEKGGILDRYVEAIRQAHSKRIVYAMPDGEDPGNDALEWPLRASQLNDDPDED